MFACSPDRIDTNSTLSEKQENSFISVTELAKEDAFYSENTELIFTAEQGVILTQAPQPNEVLTIRYDFKRLVQCQPTDRNYLRHLTGFYQVDGQEPVSFDYIPAYSTSEALQSAQILVPEGEELSFWFYLSDNNGCHEWDSNDGANYTVSIEQKDDFDSAEENLIVFQADGDIVQTGTLKPKVKVKLRYEIDRLNECASMTEQPQWGIMGHLETDMSSVERFPVTEIRNGMLVPLEVELDIPNGTVLKLWFTATDRYGCLQEDPGATFELQAQMQTSF